MLLTTDWTSLNKSDVNIAFSELQHRIEHCINIVASLIQVIIPNHKIWREPWITKGLSKSMDKCALLYKNTLKHNTTQECIDKYKSYQNCLKKIKGKAKVNYFVQCCYALNLNMKQLWQLINNVIRKTSEKMNILEYLTVENIEYYGARDIANHFRKYYSELGDKLANIISTSKVSYQHYWKKMKIN